MIPLSLPTSAAADGGGMAEGRGRPCPRRCIRTLLGLRVAVVEAAE